MRLVDTALFADIIRVQRQWGMASAPEEMEFVVNVVPITSAEVNQGGSLFDSLEVVVEGCRQLSQARDSGGKRSRVLVHEIAKRQDSSEVATHSFLITPMPNAGYRGLLSVPTYVSFAFVRVGTSGYSGSGPEAYRLEKQIMSRLEDLAINRLVDVDVDPLTVAFEQWGPILLLRHPDSPLPLGDEAEDSIHRFISSDPKLRDQANRMREDILRMLSEG